MASLFQGFFETSFATVALPCEGLFGSGIVWSLRQENECVRGKSESLRHFFTHNCCGSDHLCVFRQDWRKNGSGPKMRLRDQALICDCSQLAVPLLLWSNSVMLWTNGQVLQTEKGMQYFHDNLKKQFEA